ncbi:MAG TPA: alpha/beta hydrolase [Solirubrobacteraceae bacterium]|jgi:pimeloyl-ACP methyl ester carboxylesterase|nr:alpha/beta hydrolase [Solirubrobacteraceae bacterium]
MPLAKAGDIELSYERAGDGPPLLLIMGMSGTKHHWGDVVLQELRRDFDTIVYDHRDAGESTRTGAPFSIADLARDAAGLLESLELDSAHVMGISMGGMIAQELALAHPQRIRSLTLGCTYCGGEGSALTSEDVLGRLAQGMTSGDRALAIRTAWEVNVSPSFAADEDAYARFLANAMRHAMPVPVIMEQMRAIGAHDTSARLPELRLPTLVVHGTLDEMLPVQNGHMIAGLIPDSRLEILEGIGHMFFLEQPERTAELVREHALVNA